MKVPYLLKDQLHNLLSTNVDTLLLCAAPNALLENEFLRSPQGSGMTCTGTLATCSIFRNVRYGHIQPCFPTRSEKCCWRKSISKHLLRDGHSHIVDHFHDAAFFKNVHMVSSKDLLRQQGTLAISSSMRSENAPGAWCTTRTHHDHEATSSRPPRPPCQPRAKLIQFEALLKLAQKQTYVFRTHQWVSGMANATETRAHVSFPT